MTNEMWLGVARHILTTIGGIFVAKGAIDADTLNSVIGAFVTISGVAWSLFDKRKKAF